MKRGIVVIGAALSLLIIASQSTGEMKITPDGVTFPNTSTQTMAAAPPWSQRLPASERFEFVLKTGILIPQFPAVLDKETGLVWERDTDNTMRDWYEACAYCYNLALGGRKGWRLPTAEELSSLVDPSESTPSLPAGHPFTNVKVNTYWSSSTVADDPDSAWRVHFYLGLVNDRYKADGGYVRCVRGGHGHDGW